MEMSGFKNLRHCFELTSFFFFDCSYSKALSSKLSLKKGNLVAAARIKKKGGWGACGKAAKS